MSDTRKRPPTRGEIVSKKLLSCRLDELKLVAEHLVGEHHLIAEAFYIELEAALNDRQSLLVLEDG